MPTLFQNDNIKDMPLADFFRRIHNFFKDRYTHPELILEDQTEGYDYPPNIKAVLCSLNSIQQAIHNQNKVEAIYSLAERTARKKLSKGKFIAEGSRLDLNGNLIFELIPKEFWDSADIDWNNGRARDEIATYVRIRVSQFNNSSQIEVRPNIIMIETPGNTIEERRSGRPSPFYSWRANKSLEHSQRIN